MIPSVGFMGETWNSSPNYIKLQYNPQYTIQTRSKYMSNDTGDCKMYATEKQNCGSDCSLIVVSLTTENNRIIHIRKAVAFSDFTFLLQTFCNLLYT